MRREWESDPYIGEGTPVARGERQAPLPRLWAGPSGRPRGGDRPLAFFLPRDLVANLIKNYTYGLSPYGGDRGVFLNFFKTDIYF